jgi:hypothetical protein
MVLGISSQRRKTILFLTTSFFLSLILALGKHTPLHYVLYKTIPLFQMIPNPDKYIFWSTFAGAALAGFGADQVLKRYRTEKNASRARAIFLGFLLVFTLDLYRGNHRVVSLADQALYLSEPPLVTYLAQEKSSVPGDLNKFSRIYRPSPLIDTFGTVSYRSAYDQRDALESNIGMLYHVSDAEGFVPAELASYETLLKALELVSLPRQIKFLEMLNVQYLLSFKPLNCDGDPSCPPLETAFVSQQPGFWVYQLKNSAPRAAWVIPVAYLEQKVDILNYILQEHFDPGRHVILTGREPGTGSRLPAPGSEREDIRIKEYNLTRVTLQVQHSSAGLLLLRDTYYPGWRAFVDGMETEIFRANYVQRAVHIPEGEHLVQFRYEPLSYKLGLFLTLSTALVSLVQISAGLPGLRSRRVRTTSPRRTQNNKELKAPNSKEIGK